MYTSQLWWSYRKATINKLCTSYHNILKMFLGLSKFESTSMLCTYINVQCCQYVIQRLVYRFLLRLDSSDKVLVQSILRSSLNFVSSTLTDNTYFSFLRVPVCNIYFRPICLAIWAESPVLLSVTILLVYGYFMYTEEWNKVIVLNC